ncbi:hypothetical protein [Phormidium nigroviride]
MTKQLVSITINNLTLSRQNQIKYHGWTIDQTAQHLGQSSDKIKPLTQGKIGQFSVDILITMLTK